MEIIETENDYSFEEKVQKLSVKILNTVFTEEKLKYLLFLSRRCSEEKLKVSKNDFIKFSTSLNVAKLKIESALKTKTYLQFSSISDSDENNLAIIIKRLDFYISKIPKTHKSGSWKNYQYYLLLNFLYLQIQKIKIQNLRIDKKDLFIDGRLIIKLRNPKSQTVELTKDRLLILLMLVNQTNISERDLQERIYSEFKRINFVDVGTLEYQTKKSFTVYKKNLDDNTLPSQKGI